MSTKIMIVKHGSTGINNTNCYSCYSYLGERGEWGVGPWGVVYRGIIGNLELVVGDLQVSQIPEHRVVFFFLSLSEHPTAH